MCPEDLTGSGPNASYPSQMRDMTAYLSQDWMTSDSVCLIHQREVSDSELTWDVIKTQFIGNHNPFGSNINPNTSLAPAINLSNTAYHDPRHSPAASNQSQELQYHQYVDPMPHGLGISASSEMPPTPSGALGFEHHHHHHQEPNPHNPFSAPVEQPRPRRTKRAESSTAPKRRSTPVSIAPNPAGIQQLEQERRIEQEQELAQSSSSGRRRSSTKKRFSQLAAETEFVKELREQNVPWKEIVERFEAKFGIECSQARLQMRNTRLRQRMQEWAEDDVSTCTKPPFTVHRSFRMRN